MSAQLTTSVLRMIGTVAIEASNTPFDPGTVLVTGQNLHVDQSFIEHVRNHAFPVESTGALALPYSDFTEEADELSIEAHLGPGHEFSSTKLCYVIDRLVSRQSSREAGVLLSHRLPNLFNVEGGSAAMMFRFGLHGPWIIHGSRRLNRRYRAGARVFSA